MKKQQKQCSCIGGPLDGGHEIRDPNIQADEKKRLAELDSFFEKYGVQPAELKPVKSC